MGRMLRASNEQLLDSAEAQSVIEEQANEAARMVSCAEAQAKEASSEARLVEARVQEVELAMEAQRQAHEAAIAELNYASEQRLAALQIAIRAEIEREARESEERERVVRMAHAKEMSHVVEQAFCAQQQSLEAEIEQMQDQIEGGSYESAPPRLRSSSHTPTSPIIAVVGRSTRRAIAQQNSSSSHASYGSSAQRLISPTPSEKKLKIHADATKLTLTLACATNESSPITNASAMREVSPWGPDPAERVANAEDAARAMHGECMGGEAARGYTKKVDSELATCLHASEAQPAEPLAEAARAQELINIADLRAAFEVQITLAEVQEELTASEARATAAQMEAHEAGVRADAAETRAWALETALASEREEALQAVNIQVEAAEARAWALETALASEREERNVIVANRDASWTYEASIDRLELKVAAATDEPQASRQLPEEAIAQSVAEQCSRQTAPLVVDEKPAAALHTANAAIQTSCIATVEASTDALNVAMVEAATLTDVTTAVVGVDAEVVPKWTPAVVTTIETGTEVEVIVTDEIGVGTEMMATADASTVTEVVEASTEAEQELQTTEASAQTIEILATAEVGSAVRNTDTAEVGTCTEIVATAEVGTGEEVLAAEIGKNDEVASHSEGRMHAETLATVEVGTDSEVLVTDESGTEAEAPWRGKVGTDMESIMALEASMCSEVATAAVDPHTGMPIIGHDAQMIHEQVLARIVDLARSRRAMDRARIQQLAQISRLLVLDFHRASASAACTAGSTRLSVEVPHRQRFDSIGSIPSLRTAFSNMSVDSAEVAEGDGERSMTDCSCTNRCTCVQIYM